jgi:hypothetical protein
MLVGPIGLFFKTLNFLILASTNCSVADFRLYSPSPRDPFRNEWSASGCLAMIQRSDPNVAKRIGRDFLKC